MVSNECDSLELTVAETEVAWFLLKGRSTSGIAALRNTREGTINAQFTAIIARPESAAKHN
ncbi:MAG: hypothetical protein CSA70_01130 [Rhodobacterales bacterium]|nr:MAG: hypothetical protein CSA70_01130 [Rhodobacterales bacterium]